MNPMLKKRVPNGAHCHFLIAETAKKMAQVGYEVLMEQNHFYSNWKALNPELTGVSLETKWVAKHWGWFVEQARATLAESLTQPIDLVLKKQIYEALILDAQLIRGRGQRPSRLN